MVTGWLSYPMARRLGVGRTELSYRRCGIVLGLTARQKGKDLAVIDEKLIVVYSPQGGVGKTAVAVNLAASLAREQEANVLLMDWDERGQATQALGQSARSGVADWLVASDPGLYRQYLLATSIKGLVLLPGTFALRAALQFVATGIAAAKLSPTHLQDRVQALVDFGVSAGCPLGANAGSVYDYVVIDTTPVHYDHLPVKLLAVQPGTVVIPVAMDDMDLTQVQVAYDTVQDWTAESQVIFFPTFFHPRWKVTVANLDLLNATYPGCVMAPLPYRPALRVAQSAGLTIYEPGPRSDLVAVFAQLVRWIQQGPDQILFGA